MRYAVSENRATRQGRKIGLRVVVLPALGPGQAAGAIFELRAGRGRGDGGGGGVGAGGDAAGAARYRVGSHRLDCRALRDEHDVQGIRADVAGGERAAVSRGAERDADLTQYTTSIAADDVDEVRAWLGYDQINLSGRSYRDAGRRRCICGGTGRTCGR